MNNAIASEDVGSGKDSHVDETDNDTFASIITVALMGSVWACKYAIPAMREAGSGSIVNISASSSKSALPHRPAYHASKGAINAITRQLAVDYGKDDIRANAIIVGFIFTGTAAMTAILDNPKMRAAFEKNIMVPRFGEPADIAAGVVYLASDESKYVTGIELTIDGGALCHQALPELDFEEMTAAGPLASTGRRADIVSPRARHDDDDILDATIRVIADHGVSGATVDTVAARAGVSKATIYRHWGSRGTTDPRRALVAGGTVRRNGRRLAARGPHRVAVAPRGVLQPARHRPRLRLVHRRRRPRSRARRAPPADHATRASQLRAGRPARHRTR